MIFFTTSALGGCQKGSAPPSLKNSPLLIRAICQTNTSFSVLLSSHDGRLPVPTHLDVKLLNLSEAYVGTNVSYKIHNVVSDRLIDLVDVDQGGNLTFDVGGCKIFWSAPYYLYNYSTSCSVSVRFVSAIVQTDEILIESMGDWITLSEKGVDFSGGSEGSRKALGIVFKDDAPPAAAEPSTPKP